MFCPRQIFKYRSITLPALLYISRKGNKLFDGLEFCVWGLLHSVSDNLLSRYSVWNWNLISVGETSDITIILKWLNKILSGDLPRQMKSTIQRPSLSPLSGLKSYNIKVILKWTWCVCGLDQGFCEIVNEHSISVKGEVLSSAERLPVAQIGLCSLQFMILNEVYLPLIQQMWVRNISSGVEQICRKRIQDCISCSVTQFF